MLHETQPQPTELPTLREGRYIISGVLGKGGNARVYQSWDTNLRAWRAIKVLSPEFIEDDQVRARFAQEAATMARLDHPNLVKVYDISDDPFTPHIVMELCEGGAIIDWMKAHGAVPPQMAIRVIGQIAQAVQAAHEDGIIHRDIKPQNILIDQYGMAKLTDFGIARDADNSLTMAGATMGTYAFMAPEQRHDSTSVDVRTDIYSLGATLFTLTRVKTTTELFIAEADDPLFEPLPDALVQLILRTCAYRPKDRYQTVDSFIAALLEVASVLPSDPKETPPIHALAKPLPARPPDDLPDLAQLEDLLKALALNEGHAHTTGGTSLEQTTLGTTPDPFALLRDHALPEAPPTPPPATRRAEPEPAPPPLVTHTSEPEPIEPVPAVTEAPAPSPGPTFAIPRVIPIAVGVLFTALALFGVFVIYGSVVVQGAGTEVRRAEKQLVTTVLASSSAINAMSDPTVLRDLYFRVQDGDPTTAARSARAFADAMERSVAASTPKGDAILLVRNVLNAEARVDTADRKWEQSVSGVAGGLSVMLRLAEGP